MNKSNKDKTISKRKKSQITIFIIVALMLIVVISVIIYFISVPKYNDQFFESAAIKPQFDIVKSFIYECVKTSGENALDTIAVQGGYYNKPKNVFDLKNKFISYYYYKGELEYPTKQKVEEELALYMNDNLVDCLNKNSNEIKLSFKDAKTSVKINKENVEFNVDMPIVLQREKYLTKMDLNEKPQTVNNPIGKILEVSEYISQETKKDPNFICTECLSEMGEERGLNVDMMDFSEDSWMYIIYDAKEESEPYSFMFMMKE